MKVLIAGERASIQLTGTGAVVARPCQVSAITLDGGTDATGALAIFDNSTASGGTVKWALRAPQYGSASIAFSKPLPFSTGCYLTLTGTSSRVYVAYT